MKTLDKTDAWVSLQAHFNETHATHMRDLFVTDPGRSKRFSLDVAGIFCDYSKNRINDTTRELLVQLARERGVEARRDAMFSGAPINRTEGRSVLHTALRSKEALSVMGVDVAAAVVREKNRMAAFSEAVRNGVPGVAGKGMIRDVINIGIGGSDLGPKMVTQALPVTGPRLHFLSNPDSNAVHRILEKLCAEETLVIVSSKTFTTQESLTNFHTVKQWLSEFLGSERDAMAQCVAVTANPAAAAALGFAEERTFVFWNWVGGRYSLWSAIGLPIMLAIGADQFELLLDGARAMDQHFRHAALEENMPVLLALLGIWYRNFHHAPSHMIAPYDARLGEVVPYVQQLDMESNGKRVDIRGNELGYGTGPLIWGGLGINGQHAYFQLLHQGTHWIPVDFIGVMHSPGSITEHQWVVHANMLAQAEALMLGRSTAQTYRELRTAGLSLERSEYLARHRTFPGNIPSTTLLLDTLTPRTLGALIALYEHKVFVQGVIWDINSFDQCGVELGKQLSTDIFAELAGAAPVVHDASTTALIARIKRFDNPEPTHS
ncbi:glucose-6-phosphate isomerase [Noviherbaspirillum sedimenti]|uniref:Glucose-6-phosphate isomerase n=1 Tax=Noviherbaspirillum sedimenti TaxID=2320865 RepID=A0A3A3G005_9BURK|nr:glucose-6-phosphate isomerase [Noviherbaspirillum sedimenti]RJG01798.1 glucose-6-phosphate isomerase [Noviherbaspirillum sedimenti]